MGADDYVIKPFRTRELIERIKIQEKKPCRYYTLQGKYIGNSGVVMQEGSNSELFFQANYIVTEKMLALGGDESYYFGLTSKEWKIYDYEGNKLFEEEFEIQRIGKNYFYAKPSCKEDKDIACIIFDRGKLLFKLKHSYKVLYINDEFCEILDNEGKIWFLDKKGKAIFKKGIQYYERLQMPKGFACKSVKNGYSIYNGRNGKKYNIFAEWIQCMEIGSSQELFIKIIYKGKMGVILINDKGKKVLIPTKYLEVKSRNTLNGELIFCTAKACGEDIYDLNGTLIMST